MNTLIELLDQFRDASRKGLDEVATALKHKIIAHVNLVADARAEIINNAYRMVKEQLKETHHDEVVLRKAIVAATKDRERVFPATCDDLAKAVTDMAADRVRLRGEVAKLNSATTVIRIPPPAVGPYTIDELEAIIRRNGAEPIRELL